MGLPSKAKKESKICLQDGETLSFDAKENAETFKNYFTSLAEDSLKKLPLATDKFGMESVKDYYKDLGVDHRDFNFQSIDKEHIYILLQKINESKASGIDNISGKFLKDGASILSGPISDLCNLSILLSSFPEECKIAKLRVLYKKGLNTDPQNYRPISLLPLISKIIEKVIHDQTQEYLKIDNIIYKHQSGF